MPAPLLEPSLPSRTADSTAPGTGVALVTVRDVMLGLPAKICAEAAGQGWCARGPSPSMKAWGNYASEFGEGPISHVQPDKAGLPELDYAGPMLEEDDGAGVF